MGRVMRVVPGIIRWLVSGSPIKRTGRDRFVRNVLTAAGNSADASLVPQVAVLLDDTAPVVRGAAIWALAQIDPARFMAERKVRQLSESDDMVSAEWVGCTDVQ